MKTRVILLALAVMLGSAVQSFGGDARKKSCKTRCGPACNVIPAGDCRVDADARVVVIKDGKVICGSKGDACDPRRCEGDCRIMLELLGEDSDDLGDSLEEIIAGVLTDVDVDVCGPKVFKFRCGDKCDKTERFEGRRSGRHCGEPQGHKIVKKIKRGKCGGDGECKVEVIVKVGEGGEDAGVRVFVDDGDRERHHRVHKRGHRGHDGEGRAFRFRCGGDDDDDIGVKVIIIGDDDDGHERFIKKIIKGGESHKCKDCKCRKDRKGCKCGKGCCGECKCFIKKMGDRAELTIDPLALAVGLPVGVEASMSATPLRHASFIRPILASIPPVLAPLVVGVDGEDDGGAGWLGVQMRPTPDPLAAQLSIKGGVMICNIVEDSPAEKAGLERYDVVVELDGQEIGNDTKLVGRLIREAGADGTVVLKVYRQGDGQTVKVKLGEKPEARFSCKYKWDFAPTEVRQHDSRVHGKILRRGPGGKWKIQKLGDIVEIEGLEDLDDVLGNLDSLTQRIVIDDDKSAIHVTVTGAGKSIEVEQEDDGSITVRRTVRDEDGANETTDEVTYDDVDELKDKDREACKIYLDAKHGYSVQFKLPEFPCVDVDRLLDKYNIGSSMRDDLDDERDDAREAFKEAMEHYREAMREWRGQYKKHRRCWPQVPDEDFTFDPDDSNIGVWYGIDDESGDLSDTGEVKVRFEIDPDGRIAVTVRQGDGELVESFSDVEQLEERSPELYEKYQNLKTAREEGEE